MRRFAVSVAVALAGVLVAADLAAACSCVARSARDKIEQGDAALVGRVVAQRLEGASDQPRTKVVTIAVEQALKGDLGERVDVHTAEHGASCGLEVRDGERVGLALRRGEGATWTSGLCDQHDPDELRAAAEPLPRPTTTAPVRFILGGGFGGVRLVALDARGRIVSYGRGRGSASEVAVCPGGRRLLELSSVGAFAVTVRELPSLRAVRRLALGANARTPLGGIGCLNSQGSRGAALAYRGGAPEGARVIRLAAGRAPATIASGPFAAAMFRPGAALLSPDRGHVRRLDLRSGRMTVTRAARRAGRLTGVTRPAVDASWHALAWSDGRDGRLRRLDLRTGSVVASGLTGFDPVFADGRTIVARSNRGLRIFGLDLRLARALRVPGTIDAVAADGGRVYVVSRGALRVARARRGRLRTLAPVPVDGTRLLVALGTTGTAAARARGASCAAL